MPKKLTIFGLTDDEISRCSALILREFKSASIHKTEDKREVKDRSIKQLESKTTSLPELPQITARDIPCPFRGTIHTSVKIASCCKAAVYSCGHEGIEFCTIKHSGLKIGDTPVSVCKDCPFRPQ